MLVHSEILASIMVAVQLSRTTEDQPCLEMPENIMCLAGPGHAVPCVSAMIPKRNTWYLLEDEFELENSARIEQKS